MKPGHIPQSAFACCTSLFYGHNLTAKSFRNVMDLVTTKISLKERSLPPMYKAIMLFHWAKKMAPA